MKVFFSNSIVHAVLVAVIFVLSYVITAGGAWETLTLGTIATGVLHYLTSFE
jgi:hypothetical protein